MTAPLYTRVHTATIGAEARPCGPPGNAIERCERRTGTPRLKIFGNNTARSHHRTPAVTSPPSPAASPQPHTLFTVSQMIRLVVQSFADAKSEDASAL